MSGEKGLHVLIYDPIQNLQQKSETSESWIKGLLFCSQFGNQFIADLSELLDLLVLLKDSSFK